MNFNVADLLEAACDKIPDREILVVGEQRCTFRQLDQRANQMAHYLASRGVEKGQHVGIYGYNAMQWVETMFACYKLRAIPVNINYRYMEDELSYIFDNADLVACVHEAQFSQRIANIMGDMPKLKFNVAWEDGSGADISVSDSADYEAALASQSNERGFEERSGDDIYVLYTGGTTGMPKGVMWRQEDVIMTLGGGIDIMSKEKAESPQEMIDRIDTDWHMVQCALAPLMHGAAQWGLMRQMISGYRVVLNRGAFDAMQTWRMIEREGVNTLLITGDATGRPLADALDSDEVKALDLEALNVLVSSAAIFSAPIKKRFLDAFPDLMLLDATGASEQGSTGIIFVTAEELEADKKEKPGLHIMPGRDVAVLDDNLDPIEPGSERVGKLARGGNVPLGYYKDEVKTAATFKVDKNGDRWSIAGDMATVEEDGTIRMLGRGSTCINSGGEKIHPEEVEDCLKGHADVYDTLVVGVPDERWGQRCVAVVQSRDGSPIDADSLSSHCRALIAGYKVPRAYYFVDKIKRSDSGKPNYPWAKAYATAQTQP